MFFWVVTPHSLEIVSAERIATVFREIVSAERIATVFRIKDISRSKQ
jgi:hypothetical protein